MKLENILYDIDKRLESIEIQSQDSRKLLYKLIHQIDKLVEFFNEPILISDTKHSNIIDLINDSMENIRKFENELQKREKELTPGIIGES